MNHLLQRFARKLRALIGKQAGRAHKSKRPKKAPPRVEPLEERVLLTLGSPPNQVLPVGAQPLDVALGRLDGDNLLDIITLGADGRITVALNRGDGSWRDPQTTDLGAGAARGMALGLFDSGPFLDLVIQGPDSLTLARGDGAGHFTVAATSSPGAPGTLAPAGGGRVRMAATLLNADYHTDLATVAPGTDEVLVFLGRGDGTLGTPVRYASGADQPVAVVAGNFVGDAATDLAVGHLDGTVTFLEGRPDGTFVLRPALSVTGLGAVADLAAADFDGDGDADLAVSTASGVSYVRNDHRVASANPVVNSSFAAGLTGWTATPGFVSAGGGFAQLREGTGLLTTLQQTFVVPAQATTLSFDIVSLGLEAPAGGVPDAFEVSLLNSANQSLVPTFRSGATSFFNANPGAPASLAPGVFFDGRHVTVNLSQVPAGTQATLYFDLVGNPPGSTSVVSVDNVQINPTVVYAEGFTTAALAGPFVTPAGLAAGDVDGDGRLDVVAADGGAG